MKRLLYLLCIFLFGMSAYGQQLAVTDFQAIPNDMDARVNHPLKDLNGKTCAIIKVENSNMGFDFNTGTLQVQKVEQRKGEIWVYVQPGVRKMTISHQNLGILRDYQFPCQIQEACVYVMKLQSGNVQTVVTPAMQATGFLIVESQPDDAQVWIGDEWLGNTPFRKKYQIGERLNYRIKKDMYHDEVGAVTVDQAQTRIDARLEPAFGSLKVTSNPPGAVVYIDKSSQAAGTTPFDVAQIAPGQHTLTFQKPMFGTKREIVDVSEGQTMPVNVSLDARFADITIQSLPGASIEVNGQEVGKGTATTRQGEGVCEIRATLVGHREALRQIKVEAGNNITIQLDPTPVYGGISIDSEPFGAKIYIDGKESGTTPNVISQVLVGEHTIKLSAPGYNDYQAKVTVAEGKEESVVAQLARGSQKATETPLSAAANKGAVSIGEDMLTFDVKGVKFNMIKVPGGTFNMGATPDQGMDAGAEEKPVHKVTLDAYYIGQTEVTQALWGAVMGSNPSYFNQADKPVENVSWNDCQQFISKLNSITGQKFMLPTEAQWEYAARGGALSNRNKYSGYSNPDEVAWYDVISQNTTHPVAEKTANELGLYDMSGNVAEWCRDGYSEYKADPQTNPFVANSNVYNDSKVLRGGSWYDGTWEARIAHRAFNRSTATHVSFGLRLVLEIYNEETTGANTLKAVDLGLSVKWASINIGAEKPSDYGQYFAWGETAPKSRYTQDNSKWYKTSYSALQSQGVIDAKGNLTAKYDAATVNWGSEWRMPTYDEIKELIEKCKWEWVSLDGINGSNVTGPNGNSIFLPSEIWDGNYWSATAYNNDGDAYSLTYNSISSGWIANLRYFGLSIRPVTK